MRRHLELPFGAELTADGVRFRLWAPRAREVELLLEDTRSLALPMIAEPDGWFSLTTDQAGPGSRYRYRVDGGHYPDPASRRQPPCAANASSVPCLRIKSAISRYSRQRLMSPASSSS